MNLVVLKKASLVVVSGLCLMGAAPVLRLSLTDCLERALTDNPDLQVANYSIETAEEKKREASRLGYPIVDYEYNVAPAPQDVSDALGSFFSGDITVFNKVKIGVGVPVYTFGKVKAGKSLAEEGILAEMMKKSKTRTEIAFKVKQLYYGILLAQDVRRLLKYAHDGIDKEIRKREEKGGTDPSELIKMKLFRAELEKKMDESDKKGSLAKEALAVQMGLEDGDSFVLRAGGLSPVSRKFLRYEEYRREAVGERPDLKLLEIGVAAREKQVTLEKRLMTPNLAVGSFFELGRAPGVTGVTTTDDFSDPMNYTRAGIGLQLKGTLDVHTSLSKIRQARSELFKTGVQRDYAEEGVELEVKEAYLDVQGARKAMARSEDAGTLSRQLLFLTQSNYDIGVGEARDLIEAFGAFLQQRGQYFEAVFNYNVAVAKLDQKVGRDPGIQ